MTREEIDHYFSGDHYDREELREIARSFHATAVKVFESIPHPDAILRDLNWLQRRTIDAKIRTFGYATGF